MTLLSLCACIVAFTLVDSSNWSEQYQRVNFTTYSISFAPSLNPGECFICRGGGLQVDIQDPSRLLIGLCTDYRLRYSGGFVTLPIDDLSQTPTRVIGDPAEPAVTPGDWDGDKIRHPQYFHQHSDRKRVIFVDRNSCVRVLDRDTNIITTIIGKGKCGNASLDMPGALLDNFVYGMIYNESADMFYFSVDKKGIYVYKKTGVTYTGVLIIAQSQLSGVAGESGQLLLHNAYLWHKVAYGVNRYLVSALNHSGLNDYNNQTFVRFLSSPGTTASVDSTAWYKYQNSTNKLENNNGELRMDPSKQTIMIVDSDARSVLLLNKVNGELISYCYRSCPPLTRPTTALWRDEHRVLVAAEQPGIADMHFLGPFTTPTTTTPTTTTPTTTTPTTTTPTTTTPTTTTPTTTTPTTTTPTTTTPTTTTPTTTTPTTTTPTTTTPTTTTPTTITPTTTTPTTTTPTTPTTKVTNASPATVTMPTSTTKAPTESLLGITQVVEQVLKTQSTFGPGVIACTVIGVLFIIAGIIAGIIFVAKRKKKEEEKAAETGLNTTAQKNSLE